jgi:hypothetical protein
MCVFGPAAAVFLLAVGTAGAAPPAQDRVTGSGLSGFFGDFTIDARSGPDGEHPTGTITAPSSIGDLSGPVTCLSVRGNVATIGVATSSPFGQVTFEATDNAATGALDRLAGAALPPRAPDDCSPLESGGVDQQLLSGDITVVDAAGLPGVRPDCRHRGWKELGFRSRRQCVRFVRLTPGPPPHPTGYAQCRKGGWVQFGFAGRRQCLRFVSARPQP